MVKFLKNIFKKNNVSMAEAANQIVLVNTEQIGSSGTEIYSGYIYEDHLNSMNGTERSEVFDKMALSDYQVIMCLNAVCNPILSANWEIEQGEDSADSIKDMELIRHILFENENQSFISFLKEALTFIEQGFSLFEIIHKVVTKDKNFGNYIGIEKLAWRSQKTIDTWQIDKKSEKLLSVHQSCYGDSGKTVNLPAEFLLLFNIFSRGTNFEGRSFLRPCYGNWLRKNNYLKLNAAGIEKFSIPTPTVEVPVGKENSSEFATLISVLQKYTSHQSNYLTYPAGWKVQLNPNSGFDPSKVDAAIDSEDKRMSKAFLANFLELGMNGTGAYALSNDLSDFFLGGIQHIANEICEKINQKLIKDLIILNRGPRQYYPKLKVSNISDKAGKELAEILSMATSANIIIPDDKLEDHFRKRFNLPERSTEGQRQKTVSQFGLTDRIISVLKKRGGNAKTEY